MRSLLHYNLTLQLTRNVLDYMSYMLVGNTQGYASLNGV